MSDIVERLRTHRVGGMGFKICDEAADEIERLRATLRYRTLALRTIATVYNGRPADIAKEALDGQQD